ncbi:hypothetical protein BDV3_000965 [Batrachochytrium dendrobatidis]|nr:hypothetical protein O5D80_005986 [Batrachochytrium dendrobatidis]KAK5671682.1 hypothetical protein QVD99_001521 [Batrachochytrium dendrobatidis]
MASTRRIQKELADLTKNPMSNVSIGPKSEDNLMNWEGIVTGPANSPFAQGIFKITIDFPVDYPFKPPQIKFATKVYHPNIDHDGTICLGLIKTDAWKPSTKLSEVLMAVVQILTEPNPEDPLVPAIAEQFRQDYAQYTKTALEWTRKHAQ